MYVCICMLLQVFYLFQRHVVALKSANLRYLRNKENKVSTVQHTAVPCIPVFFL